MNTVSAWRRRSDGTWVRVARAEQLKVAAPGMADILEALEMNRPYSSSIDSSWTMREHAMFERGIQTHSGRSYEQIAELIQTKTAADVESYGIKCWQSDKYQRVVARRQRAEQEDREWKQDKVEGLTPLVRVEPSPPRVRRHRVRRWLRATLRWCIDTLSFRCLRRHKHSAAEIERGADLPASDSIPSRDERVGTASYGFAPVPIRGPAYPQAARQSPARLQLRPLYDPAPSAYRRGAYRRSLPKHLRAAPAPSPPRPRVDYGALDTDEDDDLVMRSARQAAAEIDWYEGVAESAPATRQTTTNTGAWSKDEHERYCAGLKKYRYGSWKFIASHVGTRTERQVMSHAQSIRAKRKRAEERDQNPHSAAKNRVALDRAEPRKISRMATSSAPSAMMNRVGHTQTPEELLMASMLSPAPTDSKAGQTKDVSTFATSQLETGELKLGVDFSCSGDGKEGLVPVQDESGNQRGSDSIRVSCAEDKCSDKQPRVDPDSPLCSPPPELLRVSTLSDESLLGLLDIPPTQAT